MDFYKSNFFFLIIKLILNEKNQKNIKLNFLFKKKN